MIGKRMAAVAESKCLTLMGQLHFDLAMQEQYLPNGIERLNRASSQFCLMVGEGDAFPSVVKLIWLKSLLEQYNFFQQSQMIWTKK